MQILGTTETVPRAYETMKTRGIKQFLRSARYVGSASRLLATRRVAQTWHHCAGNRNTASHLHNTLLDVSLFWLIIRVSIPMSIFLDFLYAKAFCMPA